MSMARKLLALLRLRRFVADGGTVEVLHLGLEVVHLGQLSFSASDLPAELADVALPFLEDQSPAPVHCAWRSTEASWLRDFCKVGGSFFGAAMVTTPIYSGRQRDRETNK